MAKYFRFPWAVDGDKAAIPDTTQTDGSVSYQQGYGLDYERDAATDPNARDIERTLYNQALFDITQTLQQYYQRSVPPYITAAMNGGVAYGYNQYARVLFNNRVYESLINNNATSPTNTTNWRLVDIAGLESLFLNAASNLSDLTNTETARNNLGLDARYLGRANNLSDLFNTATARTNLGLGTAATRNIGSTLGAVAFIGPPGTTTTNGQSAVVNRSGSNANGNFRIYSDNFIIQWGRRSSATSSGTRYTLPTAFNSSNTAYINATVNGTGFDEAEITIAQVTSTTQYTISSDLTGRVMNWYAWGF